MLKKSILFLRNLAILWRYSSQNVIKNMLKMKYLYYLRFFPSLLLSVSNLVQCHSESQLEINQITKQQFVDLIHKDPNSEFLLIIYNKFKRLKQKQFGESLKPLVDQCKEAKISKIYLIDSQQVKHLGQIVNNLKNSSNEIDDDNDDNNKDKSKKLECFFKSKFFNEAIHLQLEGEQTLSSQINSIKQYEFTANKPSINEIVTDHMTSQWINNRTIIVKQCLNNDGQCIESYKKEIKKLIDTGMLKGKNSQFKFQLLIDRPTGILGNISSQYIKNFVKVTQKFKQKNIFPNRKEEIYAFKKDIFGRDVQVFSQWLEKQGLNYDFSDRFAMFIRPKVNIISKMNTMADLLWFLKISKLNKQVTISLNNSDRFSQFNNQRTLDVLKIINKNFPQINYLIINTQAIGELIRHTFADHKYVIFKQDNSRIWEKLFLDLDKLQQSSNQDRQIKFSEFKQKINMFIDNPQIYNFVQVEKQMEINLQKLKNLCDRQSKKLSLKKYVIRICKERCNHFIDKSIFQKLQNKFQQPLNVYWIDNTTQNIGLQQGDYILIDGTLQEAQKIIECK